MTLKNKPTGRGPLQGSGLISIAEMLHASITKPGAAMRRLLENGDAAFNKPSDNLDFLKNLIKEQADDGADYIDLNIDALVGVDTEKLMPEYIKLVHANSQGIPVSVDSSNVNVCLAGLNTWFALEDTRPPLLNSIPYNEMERFSPIYDLRKQHEFSTICLLVGPQGPLSTPDAILDAALEMHEKAHLAGFENDELFFDCVTLSLSSDGCMSGTGEIKPSHTHNAFHAMQKIKTHTSLQGVHCVLGVSNWVHGAQKRRIGHLRAFIATAQEYGLDAAIVDVSKQFGIKPPSDELVEFVKMFVGLDGSDDSMMTYSSAMQTARENEWI